MGAMVAVERIAVASGGMAVVVIDPNVRVRGDQTFTGIEQADGPLVVGDQVLCREPEEGIDWDGTVTEIEETGGLVYIAVDWESGRRTT